MTSYSPERLIAKLAEIGRPCPGLRWKPSYIGATFTAHTYGSAARYGDTAREMHFQGSDYDDSEFDLYVRHIVRLVDEVHSVVAKWDLISTIDAFFDISGFGEYVYPLEIDRVFLNIFSKAGIPIKNLFDDMSTVLRHKHWDPLKAIPGVMATHFGNFKYKDKDEIFPDTSGYVHELPKVYGQVLPFYGCVNGKQVMAFNIRLSENAWYNNIARPTILIRNCTFPQTVIHSLRNRPINDVIGANLFGEHVIINRVAISSTGSLSLGITPDRVDISELGKEPRLWKMAA